MEQAESPQMKMDTTAMDTIWGEKGEIETKR